MYGSAAGADFLAAGYSAATVINCSTVIRRHIESTYTDTLDVDMLKLLVGELLKFTVPWTDNNGSKLHAKWLFTGPAQTKKYLSWLDTEMAGSAVYKQKAAAKPKAAGKAKAKGKKAAASAAAAAPQQSPAEMAAASFLKQLASESASASAAPVAASDSSAPDAVGSVATADTAPAAVVPTPARTGTAAAADEPPTKKPKKGKAAKIKNLARWLGVVLPPKNHVVSPMYCTHCTLHLAPHTYIYIYG